MFQVGDAVSYGTSGVCAITDCKKVRLAGKLCDCYILEPVYDQLHRHLFREQYRRTLQSGDRRALLGMVRDLYTERRRRHAAGRQLSGYEDSALREAQNILHSEFAYTLGIAPGEVPAFIARALGDSEEA